jgi:hypothetical protein
LDENITLTHLYIAWWIHHLPKANRKKLKNPIPKLTFETDASKSGWGATSEEYREDGPWQNHSYT